MKASGKILAQPRKRIRHYDLPGHAHFLTFSCFHRLPLLSKDRTRKWLIESIGAARKQFHFDLWAWVIMPEHVHLLIWPRELDCRVSEILSAMKRPVGEKAIKYLVSRKSPFLEQLTVRTRSRNYHRFWQAGPGHDRNVDDPATAHQIVDYIHGNPAHRGLVTDAADWYWSSAADWCGRRDTSPLPIDRTISSVLEFAVK